MSFYTPPNIGGGLKDFWQYIRADRPHRWPALALAAVIPLLVMYFIARALEPPPPQRSIVYVQSWRADRSDFDVRRDWLQRALDANDRNERNRAAYGSLARAIGQEHDAEAAANEFDEARAQIREAMLALEHAEANGLPLPPLPVREAEAPPASRNAPANRTAAPATRAAPAE